MGGKSKIEFLNILAYAYDNLPNLKFVLTGSEVGLLLDTLKLDDTSSPLYGRYVKIIRLERFDDKKSIELLRKGFEEFNMQFSEEVFYKIYEKVDGIVGWLTYFGYSIAKSRSFNIEVSNEVTEKALKLVQEELDKIFKRSKYYMYALKAIFLGMNTWFSIKRAVEAWLGRPFQNAQISRLLKTLIELSRV
jgi:AAA+ ATPase superfamily predicted ATPase